MRLHHRVHHAREQHDEPLEPARPLLRLREPLRDRHLRIRLHEQEPEGRPVRRLLVLAIEHPDREIRKHPAVHDHVLVVRLRVLDPHRLEEERDGHRCPHRVDDPLVIGIKPVVDVVPRQPDQFAPGDVGGVHDQ